MTRRYTEKDLTALLTKLGRGATPPPGPKPPVGGSRYRPYANKWEYQYSQVLALEQKAGAIASWRYGGITFTLAKKQYHKIDFIIGHTDHSIELAQIKGRWHKNIRAGIKGLKWAAQLYPMFRWTLKTWTGSGWESRLVEV
jgi:hypothetical protein